MSLKNENRGSSPELDKNKLAQLAHILRCLWKIYWKGRNSQNTGPYLDRWSKHGKTKWVYCEWKMKQKESVTKEHSFVSNFFKLKRIISIQDKKKRRLA